MEITSLMFVGGCLFGCLFVFCFCIFFVFVFVFVCLFFGARVEGCIFPMYMFCAQGPEGYNFVNNTIHDNYIKGRTLAAKPTLIT